MKLLLWLALFAAVRPAVLVRLWCARVTCKNWLKSLFGGGGVDAGAHASVQVLCCAVEVVDVAAAVVFSGCTGGSGVGTAGPHAQTRLVKAACLFAAGLACAQRTAQLRVTERAVIHMGHQLQLLLCQLRWFGCAWLCVIRAISKGV